MRDFKFHPSPKFGEALRKHKAAAHGDMTARGEAKPDTGMEDMPKKEMGGSKGNRPGKPTHRSGTSKHDVHRIKGKVRSVHVEAAHGGHKVRVGYHSKKGGGYMPEEEHIHTSPASAKRHMNEAMDNMEPEEPDSGAMANLV